MSLSDEIHKLQQLHQSGAIDDEEFAQAKKKLIGESSPSSGGASGSLAYASPESIDQRTQQWAMFIHLSLLAGWVVPMAGFVLPIILWQIKKEELPGVDVHGKIVTNWILTSF